MEVGSSRHRRVAIVAAVIGVAVLLIATIPLRRGEHSNGPAFVTFGPQPVVAATTAARLAGGKWSSIPRPPLTNVDAAVWTGHEVLALGNAARFGLYIRGVRIPAMAAYDPVSRRWTRVAPPPPGKWLVDDATWTGRQLLVWRTHDADDQRSDGESYDPRTNRWTRLAAPPSTAGVLEGATFLWTGRQLLVVGGSAPPPAHSSTTTTQPLHGPWLSYVSPGGAAYDPRTNRWHELPPPPEHPSKRLTHLAATWTGDRLVEWWNWDRPDRSEAGAPLVRESGDLVETGLAEVAYDARRNRWSGVTDVPGRPHGPTAVYAAVHTSSGLVLPAAERPFSTGLIATAGDFHIPPEHNPGFVFDPAHGTYRAISSGPYDPADRAAGVGGVMVCFGTVEVGPPLGGSDSQRVAMAAWDAASDHWLHLPKPGVRFWTVTVWTGSQLIEFGGPDESVVSGTVHEVPMPAMALTPA